jgi:hypothetical protein
MGRVFFFCEGGDRLGWWGLERSAGGYSVEFLRASKARHFCRSWNEAGRVCWLRAARSAANRVAYPSLWTSPSTVRWRA